MLLIIVMDESRNVSDGNAECGMALPYLLYHTLLYDIRLCQGCHYSDRRCGAVAPLGLRVFALIHH